MPKLRRRTLLAAAPAVAVGLAGCALRPPFPIGTSQAPTRVTVASWLERPGPAYVGHRGAAAVIPEHSLAGYRQVVDWGVPAVEVSTVVSRDGVVFCHHDLTLDRTSTLQGPAADLDWATISAGRVRVPRLGPGWLGDAMPPIPTLAEVLAAIGGRAVLCIEAKAGAAVEPMLASLESAGLLDTVMFKCPIGSPHLARARQRGLPVFGYLGAPRDVTPSNLTRAAAELVDPRDALVVPTRLEGSLLPADLVGSLRASVPKVWTYATHRRSERDHYLGLGVSGFVASNVGYLTGAVEPALTTDWGAGRLPSGLLTNDPYSDSQAVHWESPGAIQIGVPGRETFVTLADVSPLPADRAVTIDITFGFTGPAPGQGFAAGFCYGTDDNPVSTPSATGYLATVDPAGWLRLTTAAEPDRVLGEVQGDPITPGIAVTLTLTVDAGRIAVLLAGRSLFTDHPRWRGGYLHVGRTGANGRVEVQRVVVR